MYEILSKIAILLFFVFQGYSNGKGINSFTSEIPTQTFLLIGGFSCFISFFATLFQKTKMSTVKLTPFLGLCFFIGASTTLITANSYGGVGQVIGFTSTVYLFALGFTSGSLVKLKLNFRVT